MATEWFFRKDDQQYGPFSTEQLRQMAHGGMLQPTDLIWKEGMESPQPASKVKGLFDVASTAPLQAEGPPPLLPQPAPVETVAQPKQAGLVESLKTAGTLAAKQAELARIKSVSLPAAFHKLGKSVFECNFGRAELTAEYSTVDDLRNQITVKVDSAKNATTPKGFAQQAKALAKSTADAAQTKMLQVRLAQAITRLGHSAYDRRAEVAIPKPLIDGVEAIHLHISELEAGIQKLAEEKPGQAIKQSLATEGSALGQSVLNNRVVQVCLIPFCGLGLLLIFRSPSWSRRAKLYWAGGLACLMVIGAVGNKTDRKAMTNSAPNGGNETSHDDNKKLEKQFKLLTAQVTPGMSIKQVIDILGTPDETTKTDIGEFNPAKKGVVLETYKWGGHTEFIMLAFENGRLTDGGTPGYDIHKGFHGTLPANMSSQDKATLKETMKGIGFSVDE